ncbi:hypothetical protein K8R62_02370, partial [bacterium]|nr:hypothetical protein [bacterium]
SGDLINPNKHWGLAQSTFVARILFIINKLDEDRKNNIAEYIFTFSKKGGAIYDENIRRLSFKKRVIALMRGAEISESIFYNSTERAETRQATAALLNLGSRPGLVYKNIPYLHEGVVRYLEKLKWKFGAGSNINHLLFFIKFNPNLSDKEKNKIVDLIEVYIKKYYHDDGLFYDEKINVRIHEKITLTMKIIMGLSFFDRQEKWLKDDLYSTLINVLDPIHACQNFNPILLLSELNFSGSNIKDLIEKRALEYAEKWKEDFYYSKYGGFSFNNGKSSTAYYGAKVGKGYNEPDLHGTAMFIWGILLISEILGIKEELKLKKPIL